MQIAMMGNPNVGKSSVLNRLTGSKVFISNYSGTSVELTEARTRISNRDIRIIDTPGIYSIYTQGEEQDIVRSLIEKEDIDLIINILDAANLDRNLVLTLELLELNIPVVVVLNQIDRARALGITIDFQHLSQLLNCPVVPFSAISGEGLMELMDILEKGVAGFAKETESSIDNIFHLDAAQPGNCSGDCKSCLITAETCMNIADLQRAEKARTLSRMVSKEQAAGHIIWLQRVQNIIDRPIIGTISLLLFAYLGFLVLLKFIELSEGPISTLLDPVNIMIEGFITGQLPPGFITTILAKAVPEGLIIPFTIIMPAMLMVSILMSILEDTGLLPRYSVALERVGSFFGVSGQAVIPLSLGFGCRTPAVLATRIMPTEAQRFIIITLLSIVVPCAATLGILASVISSFQASLPVIVLTMLGTLMILGFVLRHLMPRDDFFIYELPPLRIPMWTNVWNKIKMRFSGFFTEVLPLLLLMSIAIRALMESGLLSVFGSMEGFTRLFFGIPAEAFVAVLITIFQRYLAPLVLLNLPLSPREATIAISMIALSLPCLPVMVMTVREIGMKGLLKILTLGFTTSFCVGIILNIILP